MGRTPASGELSADIEKLRTDLQTLASRSSVTISDLASLREIDRSIVEAGLGLDETRLDAAVESLARAIAGGMDPASAEAELRSVLIDGGMTEDAAGVALSAVSAVIRKSNVSVADLDLIEADRAAVKEELDKLSAEQGFGDRQLGGGLLLGSLAKLGVLGRPVGSPGLGRFGGRRGPKIAPIGDSELIQAIQKLQTDLSAIASKSEVTSSQIAQLRDDGLDLTADGFRPDRERLDAAIESLARAIAAGEETSNAEAQYRAVFEGSTVSTEVVEAGLANLTAVIADSNVTTSDLDTIAADRAAIEAALVQTKGGPSLASGSSSGSSTQAEASGSTSGRVVTGPTSNRPNRRIRGGFGQRGRIRRARS
ncbi:MAG: hypothetical protein SFX72_08865 [Isosphaeraceae bacterium]|nr:hypothetical protein [Isosphaeraceae bacterium]